MKVRLRLYACGSTKSYLAALQARARKLAQGGTESQAMRAAANAYGTGPKESIYVATWVAPIAEFVG